MHLPHLAILCLCAFVHTAHLPRKPLLSNLLGSLLLVLQCSAQAASGSPSPHTQRLNIAPLCPCSTLSVIAYLLKIQISESDFLDSDTVL